MPAKGCLNWEQKERLQTLVRGNNCPRIREHALILLLQNDGKTYEDIANRIGCGYRTVAHWCIHGEERQQHGIFGGQVSSRKMPQGNYRKATEQYIELLLEVVELRQKN